MSPENALTCTYDVTDVLAGYIPRTPFYRNQPESMSVTSFWTQFRAPEPRKHREYS